MATAYGMVEGDEGFSAYYDQDAQRRHNLVAEFRIDAQFDQGASVAEGRPIFVDTEYVKIIIPGDLGSMVDRPVRPFDLKRFPREYAAFKAEKSQDLVSGTPLRTWGALSPAAVAELEHFHIKTVEQLSSASDEAMLRIPGGMKWKQMAQGFIELAGDRAPMLEAQRQIETQAAQIAALQSQIEQLAAAQSQAKEHGRKGAA